jgi:osmotically-inducible protein OsmY
MKTDAEIQKDVLDELRWEPSLEATEIGVAVKRGVVTLSGTLNSYHKKAAAERAAKRVRGVIAVALDIEVKLGGGFIKNDAEVAEAVVNALKWHSALNEDRIKVKVEDGIVTLEGNVDWNYQKKAVTSAIESITGVKHILNNLTIRTRAEPKDIKQKISAAFHRSATIDSDNVHVVLEGDKAILQGKVRSWAEKIDAENAVWSAPGITKVENKLTVEPAILAL